MKLTRTILPIAAVAALLMTTACSSGGPTQDASGADCVAPGDASKSIELSGETGAELKLKSKTPVRTETTERSVITEGKGAVVAEGDAITYSITVFNGATGKILEADDGAGNMMPMANQDIEGVFSAAAGSDPLAGGVLSCATEGQRAVAVVPLASILNGSTPEDAGVPDMTEKDAIVVAVDTTKITRGDGAAASGAEDEIVCEKLDKRDEQYPKVDLGDGASEPKITIPECMEPPTDLEMQVLEEGDGAVVAEGDEIMTNYVGVDWNGAVRFDGNWSETGIPFSTEKGKLIEGFRSAMIGQKIGSTILVTMPSDQGYNDGMTRTFVLQLVEKSA